MRLVLAGNFIMGSSNIDTILSECIKVDNTCKRSDFGDEEPSHTIYLDSFYIDKYEVTNDEYKTCVDSGSCREPFILSSASREKYFGNPEFNNYPIIYTNWEMANKYCVWRGARLPTEAEWEKAARGPSGNTYPWGENVDCTFANFSGCEGDTTVVAKYSDKGASQFGVNDMAGNVWEWVADYYDKARYYTYKNNIRNPQGPLSPIGDYGHVIRGGSWLSSDNNSTIRSANRLWAPSNGSWYYVGFRCASPAP